MMTLMDLLTTILTLLTTSVIVIGGIRWLINRHFVEIKTEIATIKEEVSLNSGSSLKDSVIRLESNQADLCERSRSMDSKLDRLYLVIIDFVATGSK